jgi:hypothetical protein
MMRKVRELLTSAVRLIQRFGWPPIDTGQSRSYLTPMVLVHY